jgi:predicted dithiol-disulfide oxidoreductase (DUF899 family)
MSTNATMSEPEKVEQKHKVVSQKEWIAARKELLSAEKDLTRRSDELARRRQELPWVRVDKKYQFETEKGKGAVKLIV